jgi:DNA-binding transcriptional LysR family regulator
MKLSETQLTHLAAVVDAGSVGRAASALNVSQPALSRSLGLLESKIGKPLFVAGQRPLQATPIGLQLANHGRRIHSEIKRAAEAVDSLLRGSEGLVRVGGVPFFMDALISGMIGEFQATHRDVTVEQTYGNLDEIAAQLRSGQIDVGIVPLGSAAAPDKLQFHPILTARNVVACRVGHPLLQAAEPAISDLAHYPWVAPLQGSPLLTDLYAIRSLIGVSDLDMRYSGGSLLSVVNYMTSTDALAIMPFSVVFSERKRTTITVLPVDIPQPKRRLVVLRQSGRERNPAAVAFAAHIMSGFESLKQAIERNEKAVSWQS